MRKLSPSTAITLAALLALGMATGCHRRHADPLARCHTLLDLPRHNPVVDADNALNRGDSRVLMLGGFAGTAPGVDYFPVSSSPNDVGKVAPFGSGRIIGGRMLPGTSDVETRQCLAIKSAVRRYVLAYNRRIVAHLSRPRP